MKIEGRNSVRELLKTGKTIDKILIANGMRGTESEALLKDIKKSGAKFQFADKSVLDKITLVILVHKPKIISFCADISGL